MPALTGEPWRGVSKAALVVADTGPPEDGDHFVASIADLVPTSLPGDQAQWEGTPGSTFTLRLEYVRAGGLATWSRPDHVRVRIMLPDSNTQIGDTWNVHSGSTVGDFTWTANFRFDSNPLANLADAIRAGMVEVLIEFWREAVTGWASSTNPVSSRSNTNNPPGSTPRWGRGYWRSRPTLASSARDNSAAFDGQPATFAYPDPIHLRAVVDAEFYRSTSMVHAVWDSAAMVRQKSTVAGTGTTRDVEMAATSGSEGRVNKDFDEIGGHRHLIGLPANDFGGDKEYAWAATGHEAGWSRASDTTLELVNGLSVDPRITLTRHMQVNDNTYATPPSASDVGINRLASDLAFVTARATNARGEGITAASGLQMAFSLQDAGSLVAALSKAAHTVSAQGGEEGWGGFLTWDSQLPGGGWVNTITLTDAAGAQTAVDNTHDFTLLAPDPRIVVVAGGGNNTDGGHHFVAGSTFVAALSPINASTGLPLDVEDDVLSDAQVALTRLNTSTTKAQHFDGTDWVDTGAGPITFFSAVRASLLNAAYDDKVFLRTFGTGAMTNVDTSGWGLNDILVIGRIKVNSTPYGNYQQISVVGKANSHSGYSFDPTGLFR